MTKLLVRSTFCQPIVWWMLFLLVASNVVYAVPRVVITEGVVEPLPFAAPAFVSENRAASEVAKQISDLVVQDLTSSGLFRAIPSRAHISKITSFSSPVQFSDWTAINAQALITGAVKAETDGRITVKFRVFDVFASQQMGEAKSFKGKADSWRRLAHIVADEVYSRITGEIGYFDSRIVFVSESGRKGSRQKRLAIMDYDGANIRYLTDNSTLVLAPRFSPAGDKILYTSYESGFPRIYLMDVTTAVPRMLRSSNGTMSFAPRFSPDGSSVVYSLEKGGNTDIYIMSLSSGKQRRLTNSPAIETAPSFSPDGTQIVFESDRSGDPQLYIKPASGGSAKRVSFGKGRYGTPVWSPRGDMIAYTKQSKGRFHIGVMRVDGSEERLLTASFLDEGPSWSPNGRVIMFARETQGENGSSSLYSVGVSGRNLKPVLTPGGASDPAWSPLRKR
jgi:TolB protein